MKNKEELLKEIDEAIENGKIGGYGLRAFANIGLLRTSNFVENAWDYIEESVGNVNEIGNFIISLSKKYDVNEDIILHLAFEMRDNSGHIDFDEIINILREISGQEKYK